MCMQDFLGSYVDPCMQAGINLDLSHKLGENLITLESLIIMLNECIDTAM